MDDQRIEGYFDGDTNEESRKSIRKEIASLPETDEERILFEAGDAVKNQEEIEAFRKRVGSITETKKRPQWYLIAASISLIATVCFILFTQGSSEQELYETYYKPYPGIPSFRSESDRGFFDDLNLHYQQSEHQYVIEKLSNTSILSDTLRFYLANSLLSTRNFQEAKQQFSRISEESHFYLASQWYTTLIYLQLDKQDSARILLEEFRHVPSIYQKKMTDLSKDLE